MKFLSFLAVAVVLGCASAPPSTSTVARQEAALEANRRGEAYVRRGELENAARSYREALRISQSLEDPEGIAANAINLSIVRQRQGRFADARASLGAILEQPNLRFTPSRLAEAALRHTLLDLDEGRFTSADKWLSRSSEYCGGRCALSPAIYNTRAQLALQAGRLDEAAAAARSAHDAARAGGERAELANALRLLGIAALQGGDAVKARAHLDQALALDRELGAPRKIALDLLALGRAAALAGEPDVARAYYARALAVSDADRDTVGAAQARAMLDVASGK
jgi:tetratricopeptide (TPR) repeat protein